MDAGAAIVAFVTLGLQSVNVLYKTISGIRNGPESLTQLASSLNHLGRVLIHVKELQASYARTNAVPASDSIYVGLEEALKDCYDQMRQMERELQKLVPLPMERKFGVSWKRIKTMLRQDELQTMQASVHRHVSTLGIYIGSLASRCDEAFHNESKNLIEEGLALEKASLEALTATATQSLQTMTVVEAGVQSLQTEAEAAKETLNSNSQTLANIQGKLDHLADSQQGISIDQFSQLMSALSQLQSQVTQKELENAPKPNVKPEQSEGQDEVTLVREGVTALDRVSPSDAISKSIERLAMLVDTKISQNPSPEAEDIIGDIISLLDSMSASGFVPSGQGQMEYTTDDQPQPTPMAKEDIASLNRAKGLLQTSLEISVNKKGAAIRRHHTPATSTHRKQIGYRFRQGSSTLEVLYSALMGKLEQELQDRPSKEDQMLEFEAIFDYISQDPSAPSRFVLHVAQCYYKGAAYSSIPVLWTYNVRSESDVFLLAMDANLTALRFEFEAGTASLRDCDSGGHSLLHYALLGFNTHGKHEVYQYLLKKGLDVNLTRAPYSGGSSLQILVSSGGSPLQILMSRIRKSKGGVKSDLQALKAVLQAGADMSTLRYMTGFGGLKGGLAFDNMPLPILQILQDDSDTGIDFEDVNELGETLLLQYLRQSRRVSFKTVAFYVDNGADCAAVDKKGNTALHKLVRRSFLGQRSRYEDVDERLKTYVAILDILIDGGADVFATNNQGQNVTDCILQGTDEDSSLDIGTKRQDFWYEAVRRYEQAGTGHCHWFVPKGSNREIRFDREYSPLHLAVILVGCHLEHDERQSLHDKYWRVWDDVLLKKRRVLSWSPSFEMLSIPIEYDGKTFKVRAGTEIRHEDVLSSLRQALSSPQEHGHSSLLDSIRSHMLKHQNRGQKLFESAASHESKQTTLQADAKDIVEAREQPRTLSRLTKSLYLF